MNRREFSDSHPYDRGEPATAPRPPADQPREKVCELCRKNPQSGTAIDGELCVWCRLQLSDTQLALLAAPRYTDAQVQELVEAAKEIDICISAVAYDSTTHPHARPVLARSRIERFRAALAAMGVGQEQGTKEGE